MCGDPGEEQVYSDYGSPEGAQNEYQKTKSQICILSISMMMTARLTQP